MKPPRPKGRGFASRAYAPGKEDRHSCIAPLDPALKDGRSALRQHFVRGERAGQTERGRNFSAHRQPKGVRTVKNHLICLVVLSYYLLF